MTSRYGLSIDSLHRATLFLSIRQGVAHARRIKRRSPVKKPPGSAGSPSCSASDFRRPCLELEMGLRRLRASGGAPVRLRQRSRSVGTIGRIREAGLRLYGTVG